MPTFLPFEAIQALKTNLHTLPARDQNFAQSLLSQEASRGLSPKQWEWVHKLAQRAQAPTPAQPTTLPIQPLADLMGRARSKLKRPRLLLLDSAGLQAYRVSAASEWSRNPDHLYITTQADRTYIGKISPNGTFTPSPSLTAEAQANLRATLESFSKNPLSQAQAYGHRTGVCCFCGRALTDERSTTAGYGPICAETWGLAWGHVDPAQQHPLSTSINDLFNNLFGATS